MDKCEEHRFGNWSPVYRADGMIEVHTCIECGASQYRIMEVVEPINSRPDYAVVERRSLEQLERLAKKKIDRVE